MILLTNEENQSYHKQSICQICKKELSTDDNDKNHYKVKDHCHYNIYYYTGIYRGAAHNACNLR